jgi:cytochrome c peroxidase
MTTILLICAAFAAGTDEAPRTTLGARLFEDVRFASPLGDLDVSCATCHAREDQTGYRGFADPLGRSWHPWRYEDPGRETLRNAPTLLDVGDHEFIHTDAEFLSLEEQSEATLVGRNFGWLPRERAEAARTVAGVLREHYADGFREAYGVNVANVDDEDCVKAAARAIADFVRTLKSPRNSPYDRFLDANGIDAGPKRGESPQMYGGRVLIELARLKATDAVKFVDGFDERALAGYRTFLRTEGGDRVGNCVACHIPPTFTDRSFHNVGVTQEEYDAAHGTGSFAVMEIPVAGTRPRAAFMKRARKSQPGETDLGYWNFARFENSPLYRPQEAEASFVERTIATFKTPPLRNLASTAPYMHNSAYTRIEDVLQFKMEMGFLARMGDLRNGDPELEKTRFIDQDFEALFAFLNALNDADTRTAEFHGPPTSGGPVAPSSYDYLVND